jgi:hypothetical protein
MLACLLGGVWFFFLSMQTRIVSQNSRWWLHVLWTIATSILYVFLVRELTISTDTFSAIMYALGTGVGSIFATVLHVRLSRESDAANTVTSKVNGHVGDTVQKDAPRRSGVKNSNAARCYVRYRKVLSARNRS